jgi:serine/threonine protein phosphatase PrpC
MREKLEKDFFLHLPCETLNLPLTQIEVSHRASSKKLIGEDATLIKDHFIAIGDGMGGVRHANEASLVTLHFLYEEVAARLEASSKPSIATLIKLQEDAFKATHARMIKHTKYKNNGTTVTTTLMVKNELGIFAVPTWTGDCRFYHQRGQQLTRITTDHIVMLGAYDPQKIKTALDFLDTITTPEELSAASYFIQMLFAARVTKTQPAHIGCYKGHQNPAAFMVESDVVALQPNDITLLATDGLDNLTLEQIQSCQSAQALVELAYEISQKKVFRSTIDDITAIRVTVP